MSQPEPQRTKGGAKKYTKEFVTQLWGKARTEFIREQQRHGRTAIQATQNWNKIRKQLRQQGVEYPPPSLNRGNYAAEDRIETADADLRAQRLKKAEEQRKAYLEKAKGGINLDETDPQKAGGSGYKKATPLPLLPEDELIRSITAGDIDELTESQEAQLFEETGINRGNVMATMGGSDVAAAGQGEGARAPKRGAPDDMADGTGPSPGELENTGKGGGGGLAGAGNNQYYHGFGRNTRPRDPADYTYVDTYERTYTVHTQFPTPSSLATTIKIDATSWGTPVQNNPLGYNDKVHWCEIDRPAIIIPYWFQEASMKDCDWNKPADHLAYEVIEFGFKCPNMRLNILNNPKETANDVAPAPPADARFWSFTDIYNDYGIVEKYPITQVTHNDYFHLEDIIDKNMATYSLPELPKRHIPLDAAVTNTILSSRPWRTDNSKGYFFSEDVNAVYDMKRHPAYHEFILSEASFGLSYKPNAPIVRLDSPAMTSIDGMLRVRDEGMEQNNVAAQAVTPWTRFQKQEFLGSDSMPATSDPDYATRIAGVNEAMKVEYFVGNQSAYFEHMRDSEDPSASYQDGINQWTDKPIRPWGNAAVNLQTGLASVREHGRQEVSDDGSVHAKHISKRPPLFMIGLYKELEYRTTPDFWRYYLFGQITYYAKIKWHVQPNRTKTYLTIGLGGVYSNQSDNVQVRKRDDIRADKKKYRYTQKPILNSTNQQARYIHGTDRQFAY